MRSKKEIILADQGFFEQIWYIQCLSNQNQNSKIKPENTDGPEFFDAKKRIEKKYGKKNLEKTKMDDFAWGVINGKLSAIRWALGNEWDDILDKTREKNNS